MKFTAKYFFLRSFWPAFFVLSISCTTPYDPKVEESVFDILVVDGFLNATEGIATVKITHAQPIYGTDIPLPEEDANVSIKSSTGSIYTLAEGKPGEYLLQGIEVSRDLVYTLHIQTADGRDLESDPVQVRATPPIDSISYVLANDGESLDVLVTTHDPTGETRYYSWDYSETYEYNAPFPSGWELTEGNVPVQRTDLNRIDKCWRYSDPATISISNSVNLSEDVIYLFPLLNIHKTSQKIAVRYSILVKQRSVSLEEYKFLEQLQKTTELVGGIFDPIPVSTAGNMHQSNDRSVPVLGYFSGSEVKQARYFVERYKLPTELVVPTTKGVCELYTTCELNAGPVTGPNFCIRLEELTPTTVIIRANYDMIGNVVSYDYTIHECGDCRTQGGTTEKPCFW